MPNIFIVLNYQDVLLKYSSMTLYNFLTIQFCIMYSKYTIHFNIL